MPEFVLLRVAVRSAVEAPAGEAPVHASPAAPATPNENERETAALLGEIRRFRAAVADAFEFEVEELLRDLAGSVLARELQLAPADVRAVVERARSRYARERVLAVRAHPAEVESLAALGVEVLPDAQLRGGDVIIDLQSGTIDLSLGVRLDAVLAREAKA
jgi:flagellar biosynthesis/type III secretory pathway protein FliH